MSDKESGGGTAAELCVKFRGDRSLKPVIPLLKRAFGDGLGSPASHADEADLTDPITELRVLQCPTAPSACAEACENFALNI